MSRACFPPSNRNSRTFSIRSAIGGQFVAAVRSESSIHMQYLYVEFINSFDPTNARMKFLLHGYTCCISFALCGLSIRCPPSFAILPLIILPRSSGAALTGWTEIFGPGTRYGPILSTSLTVTVPSAFVSNSRRLPVGEIAKPTTTTVTPALWLARFAHLNDRLAKAISWPVLKIRGHRIGTCSPWQMEFVATNAATVLV